MSEKNEEILKLFPLMEDRELVIDLGKEELPYRRCGNTTRAVDKIIQGLFTNTSVAIIFNKEPSQHLLEILLSRLHREFNILNRGRVLTRGKIITMGLEVLNGKVILNVKKVIVDNGTYL